MPIVCGWPRAASMHCCPTPAFVPSGPTPGSDEHALRSAAVASSAPSVSEMGLSLRSSADQNLGPLYRVQPYQ